MLNTPTQGCIGGFWKKLTVKSFCEFINKLITIFQWITVSMIPFVANIVYICWFAMNCFVLTREIVIPNTMNIIAILQPSNFKVFLHVDSHKCTYEFSFFSNGPQSKIF